MAGTEYFGETTVQPRDHIPVNTTELWVGEKKGSGGVGGGGGGEIDSNSVKTSKKNTT